MANSKSAAKRARQTAKRSLRNRSILTQLRNLKKRARSSKEIDRAQAGALISAIDKAAKRGTIHRNAANRGKATAGARDGCRQPIEFVDSSTRVARGKWPWHIALDG